MPHDHTHLEEDHHHSHDGIFHTHAPAGRMGRALVLTVAILLVEFIGGLFSHSLALLSDAGHVLTDVFAIGLSLFALRQAEKPADESMTFGYHRSGILAAFINALTLILITLFILIGAYHRMRQPEPVHSTWMFVSAGVGLIVNLYLGLGMRHEDNLNVRSAVLHMLGDAIASAGVIIAAAIMLVTHRYIIDPILSVAIAILIAFGAWRIVRQTLKILMEGTPSNVNFQQICTELKSLPGIRDVHDVHVWSITSGKNALSCHAVLDGDLTVRDSQAVLRDAEHCLLHLGIGHVTIQIEDGSHPHENTALCISNDRERDAQHVGTPE